jgi:hypothetical protein
MKTIKKRGSVFTPKQKAVRQKPQVKARYRLQDQVVDAFAQWIEAEFDLAPNEPRILADAVVIESVKEYVKAVAPTAPDVVLGDDDIKESMIHDAMRVFESWNESGRLEEILAEHQSREDAEKHGV